MPFKGDNLTGVRRGNRSAVLRALHENGPLSRKRLAEKLGLTPAAITKIVGEMIGEGLLLEGDMLPSGSAGRREIPVALNAEACCGLGVLITLGQAVLSAVRLDGVTVFSCSLALEAEAAAEDTVRLLSGRLLELAQEHGVGRERIVGLGVAVRGVTSTDGRSVRDSFGALRETDCPLCALFEAATDLPCVMDNNVRSLFAAQLFLSRDAAGSQFFLHCGSGIGAALSVAGRIWPGVNAQCAEIGHIPFVRRGGKPCRCGKSGCLETIASPAAIREDALAALAEGRTPLLRQRLNAGSAEALGVSDVFAAAASGDEGAAAITDRAVQALGAALKAIIYLADPGKIVLYGGVFEDAYYLSRLRGELLEGVDPRHAVPVEKSRYNLQLEDRAAPLLAVQAFLDRGGMA